jgi:hypothetical protein
MPDDVARRRIVRAATRSVPTDRLSHPSSQQDAGRIAYERALAEGATKSDAKATADAAVRAVQDRAKHRRSLEFVARAYPDHALAWQRAHLRAHRNLRAPREPAASREPASPQPATSARASVKGPTRFRSPRRPQQRRNGQGGSRARTRAPVSHGDDSDPEPPLVGEAAASNGCLSVAELARRARVSEKAMRRFLADFAASGTAEPVLGDYWRLTPSFAVEYLPLFRAIRAGSVPLEPGDDDGLDHCKPGPKKVAA